jgi:hypothetical protein
MRFSFLIGLGALACAGCGQPSRSASGSGYGVGIPRAAFAFGKPMRDQGNTLGFIHGTPEGAFTDYRPKGTTLWPPMSASRLPFRWAQYRGSPSNR